MGFLDPLTALIISFIFLALLVYKRVNLGITLTSTSMLLALLSLEGKEIPSVVVATTFDPLTISLVIATFGIMLLSQLYKETKLIEGLSESLGKIVKNPKLIVTTLPAMIGLLPVAGGALMSAPLVEAETDKLGLEPEKKTYVNVWFRHTIFPVYPVSQVLILTAMLTGLTVTSIIIRQIPVVISMIMVGFIIGLWKTEKAGKKESSRASLYSELKRFILTFSPILATIISVVGFGVDVSVASFIGVVALLLIAKPNSSTVMRPFRKWSLYGIPLAAYGAFLLRNIVEATTISDMLGEIVTSGSGNDILLLTVIPAVLAFSVGSPFGGVAISYSILDGILSFTPKSAALLYISSFLGYVIAPTHLCLVLTADYFKCSLGKLYKYLIPSFAVSVATAILIYSLT